MSVKILRTVFDESSSPIIPGLPNDIGVVCLARVPISCRHKVSSVCRSWRYLFHKDVFWNARRENITPEELVVMYSGAMYKLKNGVWHGLYFSTKEWFKLPEMPDDNREKGYSMSAIADGKLFVIGGRGRGIAEDGFAMSSSTVSYFDFKSYRWEATAPLNIARGACFIAGVIDDQVYVFGGFTKLCSPWKCIIQLPGPGGLKSSVIPFRLGSGIGMKGKFYAVSITEWEGAVYDPQREEWTEMPEKLNLDWWSEPVEFQGQICVKQDPDRSGDDREGRAPRCISAYNLSENTWELIRGQNVSENGPFEHRWFGFEGDGSKLVTLGGSLYRIDKSYEEFEAFEIKDLANNCSTARPIRRMLDPITGCQDEYVMDQGLDFYIQCGVITL